jgi:hypothetical protein
MLEPIFEADFATETDDGQQATSSCNGKTRNLKLSWLHDKYRGVRQVYRDAPGMKALCLTR